MSRSHSHPDPPEGSRISIAPTPEGTRILVPQPRAHGGLWYGRVFLGVWLSLWLISLIAITRKAFSGPSEQGLAFDIGFSFLWFCAGLVVLGAAIRLWRPSVPETFLLGRSSLSWKSGIPPFMPKVPGNRQVNLGWKRGLFGRPTDEEFSPTELGSLALRDAAGNTFLTVDRGLRRIEIAIGATAAERAWLYDLLVDEYRLAPPGSPSGPQ